MFFVHFRARKCSYDGNDDDYDESDKIQTLCCCIHFNVLITSDHVTDDKRHGTEIVDIK